jgi:hypothetical protein
MNFDAEAVQVVCKKLDTYLDAIDKSEDYDFISDLVDPNQTLMALMIARGYLRKEIEISSATLPLLFNAETILNPIVRGVSGSDDDK